ncbi:MAG: DinB family protein [Fimbriimonas sp.]|nr:DinB family protein [Fimbriimonas sp.]
MITVQEAFKEIAEGRDFDGPADLLNDLSAEQAVAVPAGCPYSVATQVFHVWFWQDRWLKQIAGVQTPPWENDGSDFPAIAENRWLGLRTEFLEDFAKAQGLAEQTGIFERPTQFGDTVEVLLLRAALHCSYHLGQIMLIRRLLGIDR